MENYIWTEKYRPKKLSEMSGQTHVVKRLENFVKSENLPHCLFVGPAGCGKSTASMCIAHEMYENTWKGNFLELNASDERGIDTVRVKVKEFARTIPIKGGFKIIFLDEADSLTRDAQHALRRTMEKFSATTRFILSANYGSKIIPPIQSRTAVFRFSPLKEDEITSFLDSISKQEKLTIDKGAMETIFYISQGDLRKAINILQSAAIADKKITKDVILSVTSRADPESVKKMMEYALNGKFKEARSSLSELLYDRGLSGDDIIKEIHSKVFDLDINEDSKIRMLEKIGEYEFRLTEGSNPQIQLEALLAQVMMIGKK
ncbi:replication factor C small subunit [Candidatus Aenigmatarchaeota archaeon]